MKTFTQIAKKARQLRDKLSKVKREDIYENFGDKECRELDDFIGDFYSYDCRERSKIIAVQINLRNWCGLFGGSPE